MNFVSSPILDDFDVLTHAFLTRKGIGEEGPLSSLDFREKDGYEKVEAKRRKVVLGKLFGFDHARLVIARQVHGDGVLVIDESIDRNRDILSQLSGAKGDAIVTTLDGIALGVLTADCLPVIFFDPLVRAAAVVHAGWQGTSKCVTGKTIEVLKNRFGSNPEDVIAAMGPAIGPCCYEIKDDVANRFANMDGAILADNGIKLLDLKRANLLQMLEYGIKEEHISISDICTSCKTDLFFSFRKEGEAAGRQLSFILMKER